MMKLNRVLGIFQEVSGENEHDRFRWLNEAVLHQLLEPRQRYSRRRLASHAVASDFSLSDSDLGFTHLFHAATRRLDDPQRLRPRRRVADANCRCPRFGLY